jgi:hypothetical protein
VLIVLAVREGYPDIPEKQKHSLKTKKVYYHASSALVNNPLCSECLLLAEARQNGRINLKLLSNSLLKK